MSGLAVQYLEYAPQDATPGEIRSRLRQAFGILPISIVILGWDLPYRFEEIVAEETAHQNAKLYRWHPLLASDAGFSLPHEWLTINARGEGIPGYKGLSEFSFICPTRSDVQEWIAERIEVAVQRGIYQGVFFDRLRFPSPSFNPKTHLACFCKSCQRIASDSGIDLEDVRRHVEPLLNNAGGARTITRALFTTSEDSLLESFFTFRSKSITRIVQYATELVHSHELGVGLDCFSPTLTRMVGQDLSGLDKTCDWVKLMIYPRVFSPAGIAFELLGLANWLVEQYGFQEDQALNILCEASGLPVPHKLGKLRQTGLGSEIIASEIDRGREMGITNLMAGLALVKMAGVHDVTLDQIQTDLQAAGAADGLVISWDLWQTPFEQLDIVDQFWRIR